MGTQIPGQKTEGETRTRSKSSRPPLHKVMLHNDDYTSMEFVVNILEDVFHKTPSEANRIMLNVHVDGVGVAGVYPFEIAEMKVTKVHSMARQEGYPLRCSMEEE
ncbi:MAG TPA: ATP-dependent Clp protease adaptor ClpS [Desulfuromonadales bacterium]|nr:ATP-dependent Clp protease adaptor ClpS [Desulfuromonadales bacterium]